MNQYDGYSHDGYHKAWHQIRSQLKLLITLEIPRLIMYESSHLQIQIHGFCDGSKKAYRACTCLCGKDHDNINVSLISSKLRVAPLKAWSPRLKIISIEVMDNA